MIENGMISRLQLWLLVINFIVGSALLLLPSTVVMLAKQDGWLAMLVAIVIGIVMQFTMISLAQRFPKLTLVEIAQMLLGKKVGKLLGIIYAFFFLQLSALVIRDIADFISAIIPETPMIVYAIMGGIMIYYTVFNGLETVGRSNELVTPFTSGGFWITIFLVIPLMKLSNIQPIFSEGIKPILHGAAPVVGFPFGETIVFLMILPFVDSRKNIKKVFISSGFVGGFSLAMAVLASILVLGVIPTEMSVYAPFNVARLINISNFLIGVEAITALTYVIVIWTKVTISFYGGILAIAQVFDLDDYRPILPPVVFIVVTLSIILNHNIVEIFDYASTTWTPYSLLLGFLIPLFLLILSYFKKPKEMMKGRGVNHDRKRNH